VKSIILVAGTMVYFGIQVHHEHSQASPHDSNEFCFKWSFTSNNVRVYNNFRPLKLDASSLSGGNARGRSVPSTCPILFGTKNSFSKCPAMSFLSSSSGQ
jgi:hypothetical protein